MATYPGGIPSLTRPVSGDPANDGSATDAVVIVDALSDELEAVASELGVNPSGGSATVVARLDALDTTVSGKADSSSLAETIRDTIGTALVAGTNVTITVNDGADTITIDAAGGGGLTEEQTEDIVNGLLVAGSNISLTYDDTANTLTVAVTGLEEVARDAVGTALTAGTGITVTPNDGADTITVSTSAVLPTVVDAKGDLLVGTAADTVGRLAVGPNNHVLVADSAQASGVKWATDPVAFHYSIAGALTVAAGTHRIYNDSGRTLTITKVRASAGTAPTGASVLVDVNIGGSTIWSTQANRVAIAASANTGTQTSFNTTTIADGSYFTIDVDQIGSTVAGSDLTVSIWAA